MEEIDEPISYAPWGFLLSGKKASKVRYNYHSYARFEYLFVY